MNKETGIDIDIDIDSELSIDNEEVDVINNSSNYNERKRNSISDDERNMIEEFLKTKTVKKCPTVYANGALHNRLDY